MTCIRCSRLLRNLSVRAYFTTGPGNPSVMTVDNVLSEENVQRCKESLLSVSPARMFPPDVKAKKLPQAAVLVPVCLVEGKPSLLYTLRSQRLLSYRGQVSFPGGKMDSTDPHKTFTALRESEEEIGLNPDQVQVWGKMNAVPGKNFATMVTPVLAYCGEVDVSTFIINKHEVEEVFTCTLEALSCPSNYGYTHFRGDQRPYRLPAYTVGTRRIWGLTAVITHQTLSLLLPPPAYKFEFSYFV